jgi:hypothetical protein
VPRARAESLAAGGLLADADLPLFLRAMGEVSVSSSMTLGRPKWTPLAARRLALQGLLADAVAVKLGGDGQDGEELVCCW